MNRIHWADITAERIIRQRGEKDLYVLASGITPSGMVHFGNFREIITVEFVARALRDRGKNVRFIFSWDDYDTFRKVPKNMPSELEKDLFLPVCHVSDPCGGYESYADYHEKTFMAQLKKVDITPEAIYQAKKYKNGDYKSQIRKIVEAKEAIRDILNTHRTVPLSEDWFPLHVYCSSCGKDRTSGLSFYEDILSYSCDLCGHKGEENLWEASNVKLPWRLDWPMRWSYEGVDFEPGGKDHSSEGGSFTTSTEIVSKVFQTTPPVYLQYEFVKLKGDGGKMSSSSGDLVTLDDVLEIYEPQIVRWIFASYKSNVEFSIGFDLDVIKTYEDFDRGERLAFGEEKGNAKKTAMAKRVYKLSLLGEHPKTLPFRASFRHLCNILQIFDGDIKKTFNHYKDQIKTPRDEKNFHERVRCVLNWLKLYAPESFIFRVRDSAPMDFELQLPEKEFLVKLIPFIKNSWESIDSDKQLHEVLYGLIKESHLEPKEAFSLMYRILIGKSQGPKLAGFMRIIGKEKLLFLLHLFDKTFANEIKD